MTAARDIQQPEGEAVRLLMQLMRKFGTKRIGGFHGSIEVCYDKGRPLEVKVHENLKVKEMDLG